MPSDARFCPQCATPNPSVNSDQSVKTPAPPAPPKPKLQLGQTGLRPQVPSNHAPTAASVAVGNLMAQRFAKYWAKGVAGPFSCWKYSNESQDQAQKMADERALDIATRFKQTGQPPKKYIYSDRKLREPIIEEADHSIISRNSYGALILNSAQVMFVDIDLPDQPSGGILKSLFGKPKTDPRQDILNRVKAWTENKPGWGWRVYDTAAGMRLVATHQTFEPDSDAVQQIFEELGADPLYRVLCRVQKCFRARLTPKPWRCGMGALPVSWPWSTAEQEIEFDSWWRKYQKNIDQVASARLIAVLGEATLHPAVAPIVALHDQRTFALRDDWPLA